MGAACLRQTSASTARLATRRGSCSSAETKPGNAHSPTVSGLRTGAHAHDAGGRVRLLAGATSAVPAPRPVVPVGQAQGPAAVRLRAGRGTVLRCGRGWCRWRWYWRRRGGARAGARPEACVSGHGQPGGARPGAAAASHMVRGRIRHDEQHRAGERSGADGRPECGVPLVPGPRAQLLPAARGPVTCRVAGGAGERAHASPGGDQGWRRHCSNTTASEDGEAEWPRAEMALHPVQVIAGYERPISSPALSSPAHPHGSRIRSRMEDRQG
jgi:hypothetical protein